MTELLPYWDRVYYDLRTGCYEDTKELQDFLIVAEQHLLAEKPCRQLALYTVLTQFLTHLTTLQQQLYYPVKVLTRNEVLTILDATQSSFLKLKEELLQTETICLHRTTTKVVSAVLTKYMTVRRQWKEVANEWEILFSPTAKWRRT